MNDETVVNVQMKLKDVDLVCISLGQMINTLKMIQDRIATDVTEQVEVIKDNIEREEKWKKKI